MHGGGPLTNLPGTHSNVQPFKPRFPWWGGDLQTLRNYLTRGGWDLSPWPSERLYLEVDDGSGDRLQAVLHLSLIHISEPTRPY